MALTRIDNSAAWQAHRQLVELKQAIEGGFIEMGRILCEIQENRYYEDLDYDTFDAYLGQPELGISKRHAWRMIGVYKDFVMQLEIDSVLLLEAGTSKLDTIRPHITEDNAQELLNMATTLSRSDLQAEMKRRFDGGSGELEYCVCERCGNRHRKNGE